jgi:hypothetical protein
MGKLETPIQQRILEALGCREYCRVWRRNVGAIRSDKGRLIRFGQTGEADIQGILLGAGRMIAIEVKSSKGVLSRDQEAWGAMIRRFGGLYIVARSVEEAVLAVEQAAIEAGVKI